MKPYYLEGLEDIILKAKLAKNDYLEVSGNDLYKLATFYEAEYKNHHDYVKNLEKENSELRAIILGDEPLLDKSNIPEEIHSLKYKIYWLLWNAFWKNNREMEPLYRNGHIQQICHKATNMLTDNLEALGGKEISDDDLLYYYEDF